MSDSIKLPESAADEIQKVKEDEIILNPYHEKKILSRREALDCINHIAAALLADECYERKE